MNNGKMLFLRLCPFCGKTPSLVHTTPYWVQCGKCGSEGPARKTAGHAARAWNDMSYKCGMGQVHLDANGDYSPRRRGAVA